MTFYQKVKHALQTKAPITFPRLAQELEADEDAVRLVLHELKRRGLATRNQPLRERLSEWRPANRT